MCARTVDGVNVGGHQASSVLHSPPSSRALFRALGAHAASPSSRTQSPIYHAHPILFGYPIRQKLEDLSSLQCRAELTTSRKQGWYDVDFSTGSVARCGGRRVRLARADYGARATAVVAAARKAADPSSVGDAELDEATFSKRSLEAGSTGCQLLVDHRLHNPQSLDSVSANEYGRAT